MSQMRYAHELLHDLRYAARVLRRTPAYTTIAIATLALGIGASTAIFTIVDSVLLRPLRFPEPDRLAMIRPTSGSRLSAGYLHDWRIAARTLEDMAGWYDARMNLTNRGEPIEVSADRVTQNFFRVLGTPPLVGRTFRVGPNLSDISPEVVLSYSLWRRFGSNPDIVGERVTLDGERFTVVGVMSETFKIRTNELAESRAELWIPFRLIPDNRMGMGGFLNVVARLSPGVGFSQAQAELSAIARQIEAQHPSFTRNWRVQVIPLLDATVQEVRSTLLLLFGAVIILLLIACVNVGNLILSRAVARQTEIGIRTSLGATTGRLVRQFLAESVILAGIGGALGALIAVWGTRLLVLALPSGLGLPRVNEIHLNVSVLEFALLVTIFAALGFGLLPSIRSSRLAPLSTLRESSRGASAGPGRNRLASSLVVTQVALALVLLAAAGLLVRSFRELSRVNPGFRADHVMTMRTSLAPATYDDERIRAFTRQLLQRVASLPGVRAVGLANYLPLSNYGEGATFAIDGRPAIRPDERPGTWRSIVAGRYFEAMGIPLLRGRLPGEADNEHTEPVFVIDDALARRYWPDQDPIGTQLTFHGESGKPFAGRIIGIVGSVRWAAMTAEPAPTTYFWFLQDPRPEITIVAQVSGDPVLIADAISAQVRQIDPKQPVAEIRTMQQFVSDELARPRFTMLVVGSFASAALLLAAIGLYGVVAFWVAQRTREIAIRVALGARPQDVLGLVMSRGLLLVGTGLAIGIAVALALGSVLSGLLYGVVPSDPVTLSAVTLCLSVVAISATFVPAHRAAQVDPIAALKTE